MHGAVPLVIALLLALLQAATPFAHAMLHAAQPASFSQGHPGHGGGPGWTATVADEKPCALCAADHLPALPGSPRVGHAPVAARALAAAPSVSTSSSAPLDLFCRPPPMA